MKKNIVLIPAPITSHIIPCFYIARLLNVKYNVCYLVTSDAHKTLVEINGFEAIKNEGFRVLLGMEQYYLETKGRSSNFLSVIRAMFSHELFKFRKAELDSIFKKLTPSAVFIDIFNATDYVVAKLLMDSKCIFFFNPMPSTYRVPGFPSVSESEFLLTSYKPKKTGLNKPKIVPKSIISSPKKFILELVRYYSSLSELKNSMIPLDQVANNNEYTFGFKGVPEFLLLPSEFEFSPEVPMPWQYYLGLSINQSRVQDDIDPEFTDRWRLIRSTTKRIIYVSFGTYYSGGDDYLVSFAEKIMKISQDLTDYIFVIASNNSVKNKLEHKLNGRTNLYIFSRVPQLDVLKCSSLYVCHGGMGSIKESIKYAVPLLVFPLDNNYDQKGNALKVEFHGIGLRGEFFFDGAEQIKSKLIEILSHDKYKSNISMFRNQSESKYSDEKMTNLLNQFI